MKDARGAQFRWREIVTNGVVVRRMLLDVQLECGGVAHGFQALWVAGVWRAPDDIQLRLVALDGKTEGNVTRLCWNPHHYNDLHWHAGAKLNVDTSTSVIDPPTPVDHLSMLYDVFLPTLNVINYQEAAL